MQELVRTGYDSGSYTETYRDRLSLTNFETGFFEKLEGMLKSGARILDIGSGPGIPYDLHLIECGFEVTGVDISKKHVALARANVPLAQYILGDFLESHLPDGQYDAVISLYALFHIPRERHAEMISKMAAALRPNGVLLITVGTEDVAYKERPSFCGSHMAWSYFDSQTYLEILSECGFTILEALNERDYGSSEKHLWILATKNT